MKPNEIENLMKFYDIINTDCDIFRQKIRVVKKNEVKGKVKVDKDGNPIIDPTTGEVEKWDDTYYLEYVSLNSGGNHSTKITQEQFINDDILKVNETYIATGYIKYVVFKDNYNSTPQIVFTNFQNFRDFIFEQISSSVTQDENTTISKTVSKSAK